MKESGPKQPTNADILRAIEREGFPIETPEPTVLGAIDASGFFIGSAESDATMRQRIEGFADVCRIFLSGCLIRDTFGTDNAQRRAWRLEMHRRYGDAFSRMYDTNRLRLNNLSGVQEYLEFLIMTLDMHDVRTPAAESVRALWARMPDLIGYRDKDTEGRLADVAQVESVCRSFLELVSAR